MVQIVWDPHKAAENHQKHGIRFSDAEPVLSDPRGITIQDERVEEEDRFVTVGMDALGRIVVVVHAYRGQTIRMISARRAVRSEEREYEEGV